MINEKDVKDYEQFKKDIRMDEPSSDEDLRNAVESAIMDRSKFFYCVYKTLEELYPEIDRVKVMREASVKFGSTRADSFTINDCRAIVKNDYPKDAMLVYDVDITELNEKKAVCNFRSCPHIKAFKSLGCSDEEIRHFCEDMLVYGDFAAYSGCKEIELSFPRMLARGEGACEYTLKKKEN